MANKFTINGPDEPAAFKRPRINSCWPIFCNGEHVGHIRRVYHPDDKELPENRRRRVWRAVGIDIGIHGYFKTPGGAMRRLALEAGSQE